MLVKNTPEYDLRHEISVIKNYLQDYSEFLIDSEIQNILYPGSISFAKIQSVKLDTKPSVSGILKAIKGQYLIFESGEVLNIRSHGGYEVDANNLLQIKQFYLYFLHFSCKHLISPSKRTTYVQKHIGYKK